MPPLQRMPPFALPLPLSPPSSISSPPLPSVPSFSIDELPIKEDGQRYPQFIEGKYNMKSKDIQ